jgi:hypothetical protein
MAITQALTTPYAPSEPPRTGDSSGRPGSGSRPRSDSRPGSGGARAPSSTTTFASTPVALEERPSGMQPAARRWAVFVVAGLALAAVTAGGAWLVLQQKDTPSAPQQQAAEPSPVPPATPPQSAAPSPAPPAPVATPPAQEGQGSAAESARTLLQNAEDARQRMIRAKANARQAGAAAIASPPYAGATAAEREGVRHFQARRYQEAATKFYVASELFHAAEQARAAPTPVPPPEPAQQRPTASSTSTVPAPPASPPVQTSTPTLPPGEPPVLPPAAAPKPPVAPPPSRPPVPSAAEGASSPVSSETAIKELLKRYQQAMESRSLEALKKIWPTLQGSQEDAVRREFQQSRRIDMSIDDAVIEVSGASGTARFVRRYQILTVDNQRLDRTSRTTMTVRRTGTDWVVDRVRFEPIR